MSVPCVFPFIDVHIKKLLPLGFTRKAIRRELFLSNGDLDAAASRLLDRQRGQQEQEEEESSLTSNEGWENVDAGSESDGMMESQDKNKKSFSVGSIEVGGVSLGCVYSI